MSRREIREQIFKILFRADFFNPEELNEQIEIYMDSLEGEDPADQSYIEDKINDLVLHLAEIDQTINDAAKGWKTTRMGKVDLTIIRLAVYEIKYEEDIPTGVAINEAVEIAKKYGTDDSPSFINGVLAKIV